MRTPAPLHELEHSNAEATQPNIIMDVFSINLGALCALRYRGRDGGDLLASPRRFDSEGVNNSFKTCPAINYRAIVSPELSGQQQQQQADEIIAERNACEIIA